MTDAAKTNPGAAGGRQPGGCRVAGQPLDSTVSASDQIVLQCLRWQRQVERICGTPRLVSELLDEMGRHHGIADDIDRRLARYAALDLSKLAALGVDRFPGLPVHAVEIDDG